METEIIPAPEQKTNRKQYSRDFLLDIKKNVSATDTDTFDKLTRTLINGLNRGNRNKNKSGFTKARDNDRSRDSNGIILGPQKRIWNTGCHVSQSTVSDSNDSTSSYRNHLRNDRSSRGADYKRDYRNGNQVQSRDKNNRRNETVSYRRPYSRDDRHNKNGKSHTEEPEWFSEGPANVSETIELGDILDDIPELSGSSTEKENKTISLCDTSELNIRVDISENEDKTQPCEEKANITTNEATIAMETEIDVPKHNENHGSRFKHLFSRSDSSSTDTDAINRQLLQLLRGTSKTAPASSTVPKADVLQVEKRLRAILLGHNDVVVNNTSKKIPDFTVNKPHILTVEEIEAQLTSQDKPSPQPYHNTERSKFGTGLTELPSLKLNSPTGPTNEANSTSLLHTLMKQQVTCSQSVRNALNTLGIFSSPASRFPTSTNAVSANAHINQIQKGDPSSQTMENTIHKSVFHNLLGSQPRNALSPLHAASQPYSSNVLPQGLLNLSTNITYSAHGPGGPVHTSNLSSLRRPIVKANQAPSGIYRHMQEPLITTMDDGQRRFQNVKQQICMNSIPQLPPGHSGNYTPFMSPSGDFDTRFTGTSINNSPLLVPGISSSAANNNNSSCLHAQLPASVSRTGPMAFLSRIANSEDGMHRRDPGIQTHQRSNNCGAVFSAKSSGGELNRSGARTLEEIEMFELFGCDPYF